MKNRKRRRPRAKKSPAGRRSAGRRDDTRQMLGTAVRLFQAGQASRAGELFQQVLAREPRNADALQFYGLYCFQSGEPDRARTLIEQAIAEKPGVAPYYDNLGAVLENQGELEEALKAFLSADALEPGVTARNFNLGVVLHRLGRLDEAEKRLRDAIADDPGDAEVQLSLAAVLRDQGRYENAVNVCRRALEIDPRSTRSRHALGKLLLMTGDAAGAVRELREALLRSPSDAKLHNNLGRALQALGETGKAVASYRRAIEIDPALAEARHALGALLLATGRLDEAARVYLRGLEAFPDSPRLRQGFVAAVRHIDADTHDGALEAAIHLCMQAPDVNAQDLARVAAAQLRARHGLQDTAGALTPAQLAALAGDEFAIRLLESCINVDPLLEGHLTAARRRLLERSGGIFEPSLLRFACALAQQCFSNEFVFAETAPETTMIAERVSALGALLDAAAAGGARLASLIVSVALYRPLHGLDCADALAKRDPATWPEPLGALIQRALLAPREEARLEPGIVRLTAVTDATSAAVRAQYEANPYPRWLDVPRREPRSYAAYLARTFPHFRPSPRLDGPVSVLVAGCGTGFEAVAAAVNRVCAQVTAVDLSRASLAYGLRMARSLGVESVEFAQADLLELPAAGRRYEVIESSGVLHHLADPEAGLAAVAGMLRPGGVAKIGLYSEAARRAVVAARARARRQGLSGDLKGVRRLRAQVFGADGNDPLRELVDSEDLYTTSACRDLLFHVCEHRFTLEQIRAALERIGLRFIGFELPFAFTRARYLEVRPDDPDLRDLDAWIEVERRYPDTFAAMYVFWCHRPV